MLGSGPLRLPIFCFLPPTVCPSTSLGQRKPDTPGTGSGPDANGGVLARNAWLPGMSGLAGGPPSVSRLRERRTCHVAVACRKTAGECLGDQDLGSHASSSIATAAATSCPATASPTCEYGLRQARDHLFKPGPPPVSKRPPASGTYPLPASQATWAQVSWTRLSPASQGSRPRSASHPAQPACMGKTTQGGPLRGGACALAAARLLATRPGVRPPLAPGVLVVVGRSRASGAAGGAPVLCG